MKNPCFLPILFVVYLCFSATAFCATVEQTDRALAAVEASIRSSTALLEAGSIPTRPLPNDVATKVLGPIHMITGPGIPPTPFDATYLIHCLTNSGAQTNNTDRIAAYQAEIDMVKQMRVQVASLNHLSGNNAALVHTQVDAELSNNQYGYDKPPSPTLIDRFGEWLGKKLSDFFSKLFPKSTPMSNVNFPPGMWSTIAHVVIGVTIVVAVGLVTFLIVLFVRWYIGSRSGFRPLAAEDEAEAALLDARDVDSILARADQMAEAGEHRKAFRLIYLASLVALDTEGILRFDRSRTNWEYLRDLRRGGRRDLYEQLVPFTREFDRVWYGFGVADASVYASAVIRYKELKSSVASLTQVQPASKPVAVKVKQ